MKDNSLDGHRGKVAVSDTTRNLAPQPSSSASNTTGGGKCDLKTPSAASAVTVGGSSNSSGNNDGTTATNFDDDYNEWELGIGDLIIDLDADIEKTNERNSSGNGVQQASTVSQTHSHHHTQHHGHHQNGSISVPPSPVVATSSTVASSSIITSPTPNSATTFSFLGSQSPCSTPGVAMSNSKTSRAIGSAGSSGGSATSVSSSGACVVGVVNNSGNSSNSSSTVEPSVTGAVEHQATVDKGLKMKIKRKTVGSKYSEAKHEIVQSDTKTSVVLNENSGGSSSVSCGSGPTSNMSGICAETPKSKHSSGKGRNNSHREKKEKNRDKEKSSNVRSNPAEMNGGALAVMSPSLKITNSGVSLSSPATPSAPTGSSSSTSPLSQNGNVLSVSGPVVNPVTTSCSNSLAASTASGTDNLQQNFAASTSQAISLSNSPPMPNLTLKLENKFSPTTACSVVVKQEEMPMSPPAKRVKIEPPDNDAEVVDSPLPPEMKDTSTCTSVGTITEPDCLGPCEPGTSVMLEGIVWQETEGGVLVVNVTWRGKTYVGTLLDCTKHDWAPPRFCESPTSDVDAKATKGRGKRGRGANNNCTEVNTFDARNCVQSKLRNGKGRRTTINSSNFTVPNSPAKTDVPSSNSKRKGRPADLEIPPTSSDNKTAKRSRLQSRGTPTPSGSSNSGEFPQPSSPVLIECPEPNCNKKYKHINGLRYHQQHAHSGSSDGNKMDDTTTEDSKDVTNSSDNEESAQENMSVPASPAMSFSNSVSLHPSNGRVPQAENNTSSSSNAPSLPESDAYSLTQDLTTLASVAISDSKSVQKCNTSSSSNSQSASTLLSSTLAAASQELPVIVATEGTNTASSVLQSTSSVPASVPSVGTSDIHSPTVPAVAAANSVIHPSNTSDASLVSPPAVTVSIPTSHVVFSQGITAGVSSCSATTTLTTTVAMSSHNSASLPSPRASLSSGVSVSSYVPVVTTVSSASVSSPSVIPSAIDKSKSKQQADNRPDKYKPKSPVTTPAIRPIVPAPTTQLIALSSNIPTSHPGVNVASHSLVTSSLKPIQPKPTILGEPTTINPALESLKKEKSKHKKKNKDKERDRKPGSMPLSAVKIAHGSEECESVEMNPYPSLEAATGGRDPLNATVALPGSSHAAVSALDGQKAVASTLDMSLTDDNINENIQSPAYSDISDANDTAPVLESEVPSGKEKEDKVGKNTPDAAQSPATNINAYGIYPYYSQPPYLLPSVSPQNSAPGGQAPVIDKQEQSKKIDQERIKESRPWSNPGGGGDLRERPNSESEGMDKKPARENITPNSNIMSSPAASNPALQEYQMQQQPYPYSYGYVQGYPYSVEPAYHMHLLDSDPHYKQQYKQYIEEQQRLYKEQQQQQQQQQQHHHHQQQHHHHQQQQQHQQLQQHSHHHHQQHHHSQHQSHHQNKIHHSNILKDERDRSREHKERMGADKMSSSATHSDHLNKLQHSSMSLLSSKDHDIRDQQDGRPPSLPTQVRSENSTPSSASAALKEKQNENHQILKENIELKSQMEDNKSKINQFEMAMLYERHREDMRRYYMLQERIIEHHQQKMEPGFHHHTHHHQTIQTHQMPSHSLSSSLKTHKDDVPGAIPTHSKPSHYESSRSSAVMSPAKSDHVKPSSSHPHSSSSPKGSLRDSSVGPPKEYTSSSARDSSLNKKDAISSKGLERAENSGREDKGKIDKVKIEAKSEPEGQKPTMETTGPPPPPTNAYAYLHPSYLHTPPPHFPHMPFEPTHAVYRGGLNPMIMSTPSYGSSPYMHPQLRYVPPACELPAHSQAPDPLGKGLHPPGPPKALDLLHQVSQHYTTHKIHELQEHALMSPTPTSTPVSSTTPAASSSTANSKVTPSEPTVAVSKGDASANRDSSRSPPTQRHLHTHHHTHVGVGYPIYDPYGVSAQKPCN